MITINNSKWAVLTTCGKSKIELEKGKKIPLYEMYKGNSTLERIKFIRNVLKEENFWFVSPSGPGIVPWNYPYEYYMAVTPTKKLKDPEFQKMHREKALKISPELKECDGIFFLGSSRYFPFLKRVFYDKKVENIFNSKLTLGFLLSILKKIETYNFPITSFYFIPLKENYGIGKYIKKEIVFQNFFIKDGNKFILDKPFKQIKPVINNLKKEKKFKCINLSKDLDKIEIELNLLNLFKENLNDKLFYYLFEKEGKNE